MREWSKLVLIDIRSTGFFSECCWAADSKGGFDWRSFILQVVGSEPKVNVLSYAGNNAFCLLTAWKRSCIDFAVPEGL